MILIRADGNPELGLGHIMRCLSISEAAKQLGYESCFVCADDNFERIISEKGYKCYVLNTDYTDMESEVSQFEKIIDSVAPTHIIVDSYYVTAAYFEFLHNKSKIVYIDDLVESAYPIDILVNYNIFATDNDYEKLYSDSSYPVPRLILGTQYVPLRREFQGIVASKIKKFVCNILISPGGTDPGNTAFRIINALKADTLFNNVNFHFIIGKLNPYKDLMIEQAQSISNVYIHTDIVQMSELMLECDMAISAGGVTLYELCACGLPTITYILADNQIKITTEFEKRGIMLSVGDCGNNCTFVTELFAKVNQLKDDYEYRETLSQKSQNSVNTYGACNLIQKIFL